MTTEAANHKIDLSQMNLVSVCGYLQDDRVWCVTCFEEKYGEPDRETCDFFPVDGLRPTETCSSCCCDLV